MYLLMALTHDLEIFETEKEGKLLKDETSAARVIVSGGRISKNIENLIAKIFNNNFGSLFLIELMKKS